MHEESSNTSIGANLEVPSPADITRLATPIHEQEALLVKLCSDQLKCRSTFDYTDVDVTNFASQAIYEVKSSFQKAG